MITFRKVDIKKSMIPINSAMTNVENIIANVESISSSLVGQDTLVSSTFVS